MNLLPILYALLAALTGFSAEAAPVRERQVAAANVAAIATATAEIVRPRVDRAHLARLDRAADEWRYRVGKNPATAVTDAAPASLPRAVRPARRRE